MPVSSSRPADCRPNGPSFEAPPQQAAEPEKWPAEAPSCTRAQWIAAVQASTASYGPLRTASFFTTLKSFPHSVPKLRTIGKAIGRSPDQARRNVRELEKLGLLERRAFFAPDGTQRSNDYTAVLPPGPSVTIPMQGGGGTSARPLKRELLRGNPRAEQHTHARERAAGAGACLPALGFPKDLESPSSPGPVLGGGAPRAAGGRGSVPLGAPSTGGRPGLASVGPSKPSKASMRPKLCPALVARLERLPYGLDAVSPILRAGVDAERAVSRLEAAQPRHAGRYVHSVIKGLEVEQMRRTEAEEAQKHDFQPEPRVRKSAAEKLTPPRPPPVPSPRGAPQLADRFLAVLADKRRALSDPGG